MSETFFHLFCFTLIVLYNHTLGFKLKWYSSIRSQVIKASAGAMWLQFGCDCIVTLAQLFTPKSYLLCVSLISHQSDRNHFFPFYSTHYSNKEKYTSSFTPCSARVIQFFLFSLFFIGFHHFSFTPFFTFNFYSDLL